MWVTSLAMFGCLAAVIAAAAAGDNPPTIPLKVEEQPGKVALTASGRPVANYVFRDEEIARPFFANVYAPGSLLVTRQHPPKPDVDAVDHATMHPGIWLAFGDISGSDFWRNKGRVEHVEFVERPTARFDAGDGVVSFVAKNRYVAGDKTVCIELARHTVRASKNGYLFQFDSSFSGEAPFAFGDQEEMGLGIRLATPLVVKGGSGAITNRAGDKNEKEVWGQTADWCDYSGTITTPLRSIVPGRELDWKRRAGLLLVPHPQNFRPSWMHARDYGVLVANPFGQRAFTKGAPSRIDVKPGDSLRLRFGVWAYSSPIDEKVNLAALAAEYVRLTKEP
jgi:hypothetical protein